MFSKTATDRHNRISASAALRRAAAGKEGSYIVEAAIALPLFLIAVLVMSSIILMYSCIESSSFAIAGEMRRSSAEAIYADTGILVPHRVKERLLRDHSQVDQARTTDFGYRVSRWGQDELIVLSMRLRLRTKNPMGLRVQADYDLSMVTRAYVGRIRDISNMTAGEMAGDDAEPVFIFPKRGEKYHSKGCGFLTAASTSGVLTSSVRRKYKPCPLCGSRKASNGSLIYYFPAAGEDYHLGGCPALQRNYIEIDKKDAQARGYTPCSKCGG